MRTSKQIRRSPERVEEYLGTCQKYLMRAEYTLKQIQALELTGCQQSKALQLQGFIEHAHCQVDLVRRCLLDGGKIPQQEKVFSIFEPHTRWIVKGKAGVSQELGVLVAVIEDQHMFILHHRILWQGSDVDHAVPFIVETQQLFPELLACSFDRGFHSPDNQRQLGELLNECALPRKGYLSVKALTHQ